MSDLLSDRAKNAIPIFIILILIIYSVKPKMMFSPDGKPKSNGVGRNSDGTKKTVFSMNNLVILIAFISFYIFKKE